MGAARSEAVQIPVSDEPEFPRHIIKNTGSALLQAALTRENLQKAFPKADYTAKQVGLVVKVQKPRSDNAAWLELKKIARGDRRIRIIEQTRDRPALLALYQACNCYISLHRAEGFGRGMAEALQLGLHVICTGYSGNVDFCQPPYADLVKYRLVRVKKDQYPRASGQVWAEPNVRHAAQLMRQFVENSEASVECVSGVVAPSMDFSIFAPEVVGVRYKKRLNEIWAKRRVTKCLFETKPSANKI
jgi:glycosyltransferase involved in cell wall biosynthesis